MCVKRRKDGRDGCEAECELKRKIRSQRKCSDNGVCLTFRERERVLRGNDVIGKCGVEDGSTVNVMERLRGGGRHQNKKNQSGAQKKRDTHPEEGETQAAQEIFIPECEKEKVVQQFKENGLQDVIISLSEGR